MSKAIFKVWTVHRSNDDRNNGPITEVCSTKERANTLARGRGWYGGNAPVQEAKAIELDGEVYLLLSGYPVDLDGILTKKKEDLKKSAKAKLTKEELQALGIE